MYVPTSQCSVSQLKRHVTQWTRELRSKYERLDKQPTVAVFPVIRAQIPWTPPAVVEGPIAIKEAEGLLHEVQKELLSEEGRARIERLRDLLIPR